MALAARIFRLILPKLYTMLLRLVSKLGRGSLFGDENLRKRKLNRTKDENGFSFDGCEDDDERVFIVNNWIIKRQLGVWRTWSLDASQILKTLNDDVKSKMKKNTRIRSTRKMVVLKVGHLAGVSRH